MLTDEIRKRMFEAMKDKRAVDKAILQVVLGEISNAETRGHRALTEEEIQGVIRKVMKSNDETLHVADRAELKERLARENEVLASLLPARWSVEQIVGALGAVADAIRAAGSDGQATGVAMKHLKGQSAPVDGKDVAQAVKTLRQAP